MEPFVGRENELKRLEGCVGKGRAVLVYGRRRIGKTSMLHEFCKGRDVLWITCPDSTLRVILTRFAEAVEEYTGEVASYRNLTQMKRGLEEVCRRGAIIVVDEYQYLIKRSKGASDSMFQEIIDLVLKDTESTIILCGSAVSVMKKTGTDGGKPLYGRFSEVIRLRPLSFSECSLLHPAMSDDDAMRLYLTVGGIPKYHVGLASDTYEGILRDKCLDSDSWESEASFLMKADYPSSEKHDAILYAISRGSVSVKTISESIGVDEPTCSEMLAEMESNEVIERINPMMGAPKRGRFAIRDDFLAFRYGILARRREMFSRNDSDAALSELRPYLSEFLGHRFEFYCRDYIVGSYSVTDIGRWWIDDPKRDIHEDIDVVARIREGRSNIDLFAECKFTRKPAGFAVLNTLDSRTEPFKDRSNWRLMIMSWSGFEEDLEEFAEDAGVLLVGPDRLTGKVAPPGISM